MNISDYINISRINDALHNLTNVSFNPVYNKGLLSIGFDPYVQIFGSWLWGLIFGVIGIILYSWQENKYILVGYLIAVTTITLIIIPTVEGDLIAIITALATTAILYEAFIVKKKKKGGKE